MLTLSYNNYQYPLPPLCMHHTPLLYGLDLSADVLDSLLKLCHLDYYNTVFRSSSYPLNALHGPLKFNNRPRRLLDHLR